VCSSDLWELYYIQPGVMRAFDNFWNTTGQHPELVEHYANAWQAVAERFAGNDTVVAYDLMNGPWGGSQIGKASCKEKSESTGGGGEQAGHRCQ